MRECMDVSEALPIKGHQSLSHGLIREFCSIYRSAQMLEPFGFALLKVEVSLKFLYGFLQGDYNG
ncbi:hypothetical protein N836_07050 [Leptolyngbya sp. Heron Island J]|nr:hypothetical protein N836_07050 [Leptolyngbya sp. Heron Island J]